MSTPVPERHLYGVLRGATAASADETSAHTTGDRTHISSSASVGILYGAAIMTESWFKVRISVIQNTSLVS